MTRRSEKKSGSVNILFLLYSYGYECSREKEYPHQFVRVVRLCCRRRRLLLLCSLGLLGEALEAHPDSYLNTLLFAINRSLFPSLYRLRRLRAAPRIFHTGTQKKRREREKGFLFFPAVSHLLVRHATYFATTSRRLRRRDRQVSITLGPLYLSPLLAAAVKAPPSLDAWNAEREEKSRQRLLIRGKCGFLYVRKGGKERGERLLDVTPRSVLRSLGRLLLLPLRMCGNE